MTDRYIDPNSGAAPQPGGYANAPEASEEAGESREAAINDAVTTPDTENVEPTPDAEDVAAAQVAGAPDPDAEGLVLSEDGQSTVDAETGEPHEEQTAEVTDDGSNARTAEVTDDGSNTRAPENEAPADDQIQTVEGKDQAADPNDENADTATATEGDGQQTDVADADAVANAAPPAGNASRDAWVTYAKSEAGGSNTDEQLEGMTRDEIRDLYA